MNEYDKPLMDKPSIESFLCPFCGRLATCWHHIVPRSRGGHRGPLVHCCGHGNESGCHKKFHDHTLHLKWNEDDRWWEFLETEEGISQDKAMRIKEGWKSVKVH